MDKLRTHIRGLLRKSEKYTRTDMVYLAKGGSWLLSRQVIAAVITLLLSVAFAHLLPKAEFGTYRFLLSLGTIITIFSFTGMPMSVTQATARGLHGVLKEAFKTTLKWSVGIVLAGAIGALYYAYKGNEVLAIGILFAGALSPFIQAGKLYSSYLNGKKDFRRTATYGIAQALIPALALFITLLFSNEALVIALVYFLANALTLTSLYILTTNVYKPSGETDHQNLRYGKHMSIINVLTTIEKQADKILIFHFLGAAQLAIYSFAIAPPEQIRALFKPLTTLAMPKLSQMPKDRVKKVLPPKLLKLAGILTVVAGAYILLAPFFFDILYPQYYESIVYSQVFALTLIVAGRIPSTALASQLAIKQQYILKTTSSLLRLAIMVALVIPFGIMGVIVSRVIGRAISYFLALFLLKRL